MNHNETMFWISGGESWCNARKLQFFCNVRVHMDISQNRSLEEFGCWSFVIWKVDGKSFFQLFIFHLLRDFQGVVYCNSWVDSLERGRSATTKIGKYTTRWCFDLIVWKNRGLSPEAPSRNLLGPELLYKTPYLQISSTMRSLASSLTSWHTLHIYSGTPKAPGTALVVLLPKIKSFSALAVKGILRSSVVWSIWEGLHCLRIQ